ncbi:hypothetical protein BV898_16806 [Hypsibius exemplaris]|uniref:VWFC domain-containing protein n=1 Tax=Hypsibius exemplaris TaxID=2072580 RepID=A0A9X6NGK3_HYPEX|nr:hypothetical protein BV898_16806 [Hypsibius exemplaris]
MCLVGLLLSSVIWTTAQAERSQCTDYQGRTIEGGSNYIPSKFRPCTECLCISGVGVRCGPPLCLGRVNCALARWNTTICCNKDCLERGPANRYTDNGGAVVQRNRDYQVPFWISRADSGPLYGIDADSGYKRTNDDGQFAYVEENSTLSATPSRTQNLPSPYYPILIGLISCAPVALCIICVNAVRKYFTLRNQFPAGQFFPRRRRGTRARGAAHASTSTPTVFTEPPPDYKDLTTSKFRLSEDLPRYEDVIRHDRSSGTKIFATTSSAQFTPPERVNFAFSVVDETGSPSPPVVLEEPNPVVVHSNPNPAPLTAAPPSAGPTVPSPAPPTLSKDVRDGVDNPAHEA